VNRITDSKGGGDKGVREGTWLKRGTGGMLLTDSRWIRPITSKKHLRRPLSGVSQKRGQPSDLKWGNLNDLEGFSRGGHVAEPLF